ncbi:MAG TPA: ABC transporter permease [Gammaproteobacteria bacterium]|nr:ABC transporter permease [Gammaproteobacteria bacterium]
MMFRPLPLAIGLRYLRVRRRSRFVSVVALVAVLGVALGVGALIVVLSVMNGMQDTLTGSILGVTSDVTVATANGDALPELPRLVREARSERGVVATAPYAERQIVLGRGEALAGAVLQGVQPQAQAQVSTLGRHMLLGSLAALAERPWAIVLGRDLAFQLGVVPGDKLSVILPRGLVTPVGFVPRMRRFTVVGIFYSGSPEYDAGLALTSLSSAQKIFEVDGASGLRLKLAEPFRAPEVAARLRAIVPAGVVVRDWQSEHQSLFAALANEQRMMFVLVALAVLIAAFNVLGVLTVLVADKRSEIAVLASLGLPPRGILAAFLALGSTIGAIGILLGLGGGLAIAWNINAIVSTLGRLAGHPIFSAGAIAMPGLPSRISPEQVGIVVAIAAVLVVIAAWVPARRAAHMRPVEALADG